MINKENNNKEEQHLNTPEPGILEVAYMDVQCHLIIKDKDTNEILVNQRG